jgi:hypothetical protein
MNVIERKCEHENKIFWYSEVILIEINSIHGFYSNSTFP